MRDTGHWDTVDGKDGDTVVAFEHVNVVCQRGKAHAVRISDKFVHDLPQTLELDCSHVVGQARVGYGIKMSRLCPTPRLAMTDHSSQSAVYFYGHKGARPYTVFSNFYPAKFVHHGICFEHSEQALMYAKANLMGDIGSCTKILQTSDPAICKRLGRRVAPYKEELWCKKRYNIMVDIIRDKFTQNSDMERLLRDTGNARIAEASPTDCVWGIGLSMADAYGGAPWRGTNLLGEALMEVRSQLPPPL